MDLGNVTPQQLEALNVLGLASLAQALVVFARMIGIMMVVPFFGSMNIPMTVRVGIAAMLTMIITPLVGAQVQPETGGGIEYIILLVNQVLIGLMLGLVVAFVFHGIESAGRIIDTQRGSNISDLLAPQTGERTSPAGQWLMQFSLVLFVLTGQHLILLKGMIESFRVLPPQASLEWIGVRANGEKSTELVLTFAQLSSEVLVIAVTIAGPALVTILLSDVALGIINRGAPQVNVFMFSMPIKAVLGIAAMLTSLGVLVIYLIGGDGDPGLFEQVLKGGGDMVSLPDIMELMRRNENG